MRSFDEVGRRPPCSLTVQLYWLKLTIMPGDECPGDPRRKDRPAPVWAAGSACQNRCRLRTPAGRGPDAASDAQPWPGRCQRRLERARPRASLDDYPAYVRGADLISFDVYPVAGLDRPDRADFLWYVPKGVDRLLKWTGGASSSGTASNARGSTIRRPRRRRLRSGRKSGWPWFTGLGAHLLRSPVQAPVQRTRAARRPRNAGSRDRHQPSD